MDGATLPSISRRRTRTQGVIAPTSTAGTHVLLYAEYKEPLYAAPPLLQRMVDAGRLGRKTGSGFYPYA
ncbi:3-hydroxyacyl-CoA dehydrogenase family protein [Streptomyces anulatus]|uniref:3-hydroxyacyl-CoA dehydrogenase family protein n=1 Tax=Streptomyces anulatus TaxID=1892 RepID=UPI002277E12C|nr:3-hydroxyacyl-CoA dehydrogenase family protein [Streptomyces anulatus]